MDIINVMLLVEEEERRNINKRRQNKLNLIRRTLRDTQNPFDIPDNSFVKLSFEKHIMNITSCAYKKLGFVLRASKYFNNVHTLRLQYCALVRPHLEYASIIWAPFYTKYDILIERIQHRFLRRVSFITDNPMRSSDHSYDVMLNNLRLITLANRRTFLDLLFLFKLNNGRIICSELLECVGLRAPARPLRNGVIFNVEFHRTSYGRYKPLNRVCLLANEFSDRVDFFQSSLCTFRRTLFYCLR